MKAAFVIFAAVMISVATAQVWRRHQNKDLDEYPLTQLGSGRRTGDLKINPQTGAVSGNYPVGGGDVFGKVQGAAGEFGYRHNVFDNNNGKLDASVVHGRDLGLGSSSTGGRLDWTGNRGQATVDVNRYNNGLTNLNAAGGAKWPLGKNTDASLQGTYSQTFGQGRPDYGVVGTITGRF